MKPLKIILLLLGIGFTGWLIWDTGWQRIANEFTQLGPAAILFFLPYLVVYLFDNLGWKYSFLPEIRNSFWHLFQVRLAGEAINYTTPTAYIGGEPLKAYLLSKQGVPLPDGLASVVIGKFLMTVTEVVFILMGIFLAVQTNHPEREIFLWLLLFFFAFLVLLGGLFFIQKKGLAQLLERATRKIGFVANFFQDKQEQVAVFDQILHRYYSREKGYLFLSCLYYFLGWCCGAFEIYILLVLLGQQPDLATVFAIEAIAVAIKGAGFIVPGSIGIQEGGQVWTFMAFGFDKSVGITFSLLRRIREILWILVGLVFLYSGWNEKEMGAKLEEIPISQQ